MAGRIPREFIDELLNRVDIVDVVDGYVPLKKAGKDHKACCPFHNEKTPSFTVSGDKQFYHCFGCGAHGTVIGFLMEYAHMDFVEAVEELAGRAGLEVPREQGVGAPADALAPLYEVLEKASAYYQAQLREHPEAPRAVEYLKGRGLSGEVAAEFKLGFAPPGWDNLAKALGRGDVARGLLERAGLLVARQGGGAYDRFRGRIMFPILDRRGRTVGFGGRVLGDDSPKYLNSPETPVFHKGRELYGLFQARKAAAKLERLIVVEGYMDVVALAQAGIRNAVATLGTAATTNHIEQLFRVCRDLVFCFDGDEAGRRAAWRALETALPAMREGRQAFFMFLPEGEDPDSLVRARGRGGFEEAVAGAESLGTFLFQHLDAEVDRGTIDGRSRLVALARPLIDKIPPGPFRELASRQLGELTGLPPENSATLSSGRGSTTASRPAAFPGQSRRQSPSLVRRVVTLLLHHPQLGRSAGDVSHLRRLALPGVPLLIELLETLEESPELTTAGLIERFRGHDAGRHLARLAAEEAATLDEALEQEFRDSLRRLRVLADDERFKELASKARAARLSAEEQREFARLSGGPRGAEEGSVETPGPGKGA